MITQFLLDLATNLCVVILQFWPAMPEVNNFFISINSALFQLGNIIGALQPIVPFEVMIALPGVFAVMVGHFGLLLVIRLIAWTMNR